MATLQRDIPFDAKMCTGCFKMCRFVCPTAIATKNESITPYGRSSAYHLASINKIKYSPKAVESIYQCATCGLCKTWCKPEVDVANIVERARKDIVGEGLAPKNITRLLEITQKNSNPYGEPNSKRFSKIRNGANKKDGKSEILYFVGCTTAYRHPEIADAIMKVLTIMGEDFTVLADSEKCCGSPLIRLGLEDASKELLAHNSEAINNLNCKMVVTGCPGCHRTLKEDYPRLGYKLDAEVMHFTEYLDSSGKGTPKVELSKRLTYHDPCHLGRHSNIIDQPRNIIQQIKGVRLIEMEWNRKNSNCCGSGGGLRVSYPSIAEKLGTRRLDEAYATGAEMIATACPFCKDHLIEVQNARMEDPRRITVVDLAEILTGATPK
ncbi:MAG: (Fe-S)-binding protein [Promethearchaeati archaeon SRVP18_Atabeyarchaeia-1]